MTKTLMGNPEFEYSSELYDETEKQFLTCRPERLDKYRPEAKSIEQIYLSHPDEPYSLRLRETFTAEGISYTAALKTRGRLVPNGWLRKEIETEISPEVYAHFSGSKLYPRLRKLRACPAPGVIIDWVEGFDIPQVEIENIGSSADAKAFFETHREDLLDMSGTPELSSEHQSHTLSGGELLIPPEVISVEEALERTLECWNNGMRQIVIGVSGRSGSGKTTFARELASALESIDSQELAVAHLSSDDYHRGKAWLEASQDGNPWQNWDAPIVYDTEALAKDLLRLKSGETIEKRYFDFTTEEPALNGVVHPSPIVIVDGIYAGSRDLAGVRNLHFHIDTPLATSIGRRIERDASTRLNDSLGSVEDILRYQLEVAEPTFKSQERPMTTSLATARQLGRVALESSDDTHSIT